MPTWFKRQRALTAATKEREGNDKIVLSPSEPWVLKVLHGDDVDEGRNPEQSQARGGDEEDVIHATTMLTTTTSGQTTSTFLDSWIPEVISDQDVGLVAMFNEVWHKLEDSTTTAVQMTVGGGDGNADEDDLSMLSMFRQVGGAAATEFENGRRVLTHATIQQMKWAIQQAMEAWKTHAALLTTGQSQQEKNRNIFLPDTMYEI